MKKLVIALLLVANSLFAVTLAEINAGPYPRAFITQVDIRDQGEIGTKLNTVTYQYWYSGYPYENLKYSGKIESWVYAFSDNYNNLWYYSPPWDQFVNPNDLSVTYVYFNLNGYSSTKLDFFYNEFGQKIEFNPSLIYVSGNIWAFKHVNSSNVSSYEIRTNIQASDGSAILGNNVSISRNIK